MQNGSVQKSIEKKLKQEFQPAVMNVLNESHQHAVPKDSETHFRIELVSEDFSGLSRVERFRKVHQTLAEELKKGVHALSLKLFTRAEWGAAQQKFGAPSPPCAGGSDD